MKILSVEVVKEVDTDLDTSYMGEYSDTPGPGAIDRRPTSHREYRYFNPANEEYAEQDYQRLESLNNGDWHFINIHAKAKVQLTEDGPIQVIRSCGIGGIESDSGDADIAEYSKEELEQLRGELLAMRFSGVDLREAFKLCVGGEK